MKGVWPSRLRRLLASPFAGYRIKMDADPLAEAVRAACLEAAVAAYENAGIQGLCEAGRWEAAVGAIESLDLRALVRELEAANRRLD